MSSPSKSVGGVYVKLPSAAIVMLPPSVVAKVPTVVTVWVSPSGSKSFTNTLPSTGVFTSVPAVSAFAMVMFCPPIGNTSINTVAVSLATGLPSSTILYWNVSGPEYPVGGVYT